MISYYIKITYYDIITLYCIVLFYILDHNMSYCNYSSLIPLCNMTFGITLQIAGKGLSYICHWVSN